MPLTLKELGRLLSVRGSQQYGREAVSQLEHALQQALIHLPRLQYLGDLLQQLPT